jgi:hypothetical protein
MRRFPIGAIACACLLLAACGGTTTRQASIRRATAEQLAGESDALAAALRRGDSCAAANKAKTLHTHVVYAIASGAIPRSLAASARSASSRLVERTVCMRPPASSPMPPAPPMCAQIDARKKALEQEKHSLDKHKKDQAAAARKHEIDQEEHALDKQRKGCK